MYCPNCGAQNDDNAAFCGGCGAALKMQPAGGPGSSNYTGYTEEPVRDQPSGRTDRQGGGSSNKLIGIIAVVVIVVVALVAALLLTRGGGKGYEKVAKNFVEAVFDLDAEEIFDLMPDELLDSLEEETGYDIDILVEEVQKELDSEMESFEQYWDEIDFSYEVLDSDDVTGFDLADIQETYEELDIDVKAAKCVEMEVGMEFLGEEYTESLDVYVIKVGSKWYLDVMNSDMSGLIDF